ncbi:MAG TPA: hypothetical protein VH500_10970 [Nitrososphaeraceae archaeon]
MQSITKFCNMALKLRDYITVGFTYIYHDVIENSFFQIASTHTICELRTNDTLCVHNIQWKNKQVAKEPTVFAGAYKALINCIRILRHKVTRWILYQPPNSAGE